MLNYRKCIITICVACFVLTLALVRQAAAVVDIFGQSTPPLMQNYPVGLLRYFDSNGGTLLSTGATYATNKISLGQYAITSAHSVTAPTSLEAGFVDFETVTYSFSGPNGFVTFQGLAIVHPNYIKGLSENDLAMLLVENPQPVAQPLIIAAIAPATTSQVTLYGNGGGSAFTNSGQFQVAATTTDVASMNPNQHFSELGDSGGPYVSGNQAFAVHSGVGRIGSRIGTRIDQSSSHYSWLNGDVVADLRPPSWNPSSTLAFFETEDYKPTKVLNANYPETQLYWSASGESVLGVFNNEVLDLRRNIVNIPAGTGTEIGNGNAISGHENLIVGNSGFYNGSQGVVNVDSGTLVTRSFRNRGRVIFHKSPDATIYPRGEIEIMGPNGFLNENEMSGEIKIKGDLWNKGGRIVINTPTTADVTGNFRQDPNGVLQINVTQSGAGIALVVSGSAELGGILQIGLASPGQGSPVFFPQVGNVCNVVLADQGLIGAFRSVQVPNLSAGLAWDIKYTTNTIQLNVLGPATIAGDYDRNGVVNLLDYTAWKQQFGATGSLAADGNGDRKVDAADYVFWRNNYSQSGTGATAAVPEASSLVLLLLCGAVSVSAGSRSCCKYSIARGAPV